MPAPVSSIRLRPVRPETAAGKKHPRPDPVRIRCGGFLSSLFLLLILGLPGVSTAGPPGPGGGPLPTVVVAPVFERDIVPATEYVGHVEAIQWVDLRARVEGFLERVNFKEGDFVQAGKILYVIEQAPYQARMDADQARVAQAEAELARASRHLERLRAARPESIRATDMDSAVAAERTARARLAEAHAALALSRLNLGYTTVRAPITGRIGKNAYTRGNLVGPASGPLSRIVQVDPIRVVYSISENDLAAVQNAIADAGKTHGRLLAPRIRLSDGGVFRGLGHVAFVDNQVDPRTGTIAVRAEFENPDHLLIPGQYVTVMVKSAAPKLMPVVPQSAVLVSRKGRYVLMVNDHGIVIPRPITIGPSVGALWAVASGLSPGEKIIVQGIQKVRPGQPVQVKNARPTRR